MRACVTGWKQPADRLLGASACVWRPIEFIITFSNNFEGHRTVRIAHQSSHQDQNGVMNGLYELGSFDR